MRAIYRYAFSHMIAIVAIIIVAVQSYQAAEAVVKSFS